MRWVLAGASGFLGTKLTEDLLRGGHDVLRLVRRQPAGPDEVRWDPYAGELDADALAGADVVANLAGTNPARPWTPAYRHVFRESRVRTTATLASAVARSESRPVLLTQSGTGGYGRDRGDEVLTEESGTGDGFLADVVRLWEGATAPAAQAGARVVSLRTGIVLSPDALAFRLMALPFRLGLGGRFGSGRQYFPAVSLPDWLRAVRFVAEHNDISGPVNVVIPEPATNAEVARALGEALHRPAVLPVPGFAIRAVLDGFADELLGSKRVVPRRLLEAGFSFTQPDVYAVVDHAVHG
jgi:uncharacterized protein